MKRWIVMMLVLGLAFVGCSKPADQSAPPEAEKPAIVIEEVELTEEVIPEEAAQAEVDPDVKGCLQLVSEAKFDDALPICLSALKTHPDNDELKAAAEKAQAGVAESTAAAATDAAQDAKEAAGEKAQGTVDEAIGGLPK